MSELFFKNVSLSYPVFNSRGMSLRNNIVRIATGGNIEQESGHVTLVTALKNISFALKDGDAVGIVGHNGAGKSTLLRVMAGIYPPTDGEVVSKGRIATVLEIGAGLEPELSGYDNIINLGMMMGMNAQKAREITPDIEEFTELGNFLQLPVRTYSSGMAMRLMFGVATSITPEILLLDEMFSTGDAGFKLKGLKRIESLISGSNIFVFASHNHEIIKKYCNRIFSLEHGHMREISTQQLV
jgi:ABC-type polysaccharide/polyol phosphate transport system ATPase subunit